MWNTPSLQASDQRLLWHPFTPMADWCDPENPPLVITRGEGAFLFDSEGRRYLDGNSSIWTNIHGHCHPHITGAIARQLASLDHTSFLGTTHPAAIALAERLITLAPTSPTGPELSKVFFSDDGSTAIEAALRIALQFHRQEGDPARQTIVAFSSAYHGDTLGVASLGGIPTFSSHASPFGYPRLHLPDASSLWALDPATADTVAAVIIEPLVRGPGGILTWPQGMLQELRAWCDKHSTLLIFDEVLTGFGRTGTLFACQQEQVTPDLLCLAKGLTGGSMPLAATLATSRLFDGFLGPVEQLRTLYYGHSYCAHPPGCAAALANLEVFEIEQTLDSLPPKIEALTSALMPFRSHPLVADVRQCGLIAGIELAASTSPYRPFPLSSRAGHRVCLAARPYGLLTRPIGDVLVFMPPLCTRPDEIIDGMAALRHALEDFSKASE